MWGCFMGKAHKTPPHFPIATRKPKDPIKNLLNLRNLWIKSLLEYNRPHETKKSPHLFVDTAWHRHVDWTLLPAPDPFAASMACG